MMEWLNLAEADQGPDGLNKHHIKVPRMGRGKIAWPWREGDCTSDVDEKFICTYRLTISDE